MSEAAPDTEALLALAARDPEARNRLLARYRGRLRDLVVLRLDRRVLGRIDPSDVQESPVEADRRLDELARKRPLPFFVWLRQLALERIVDLHRLHIRSQKRSVRREQPGPWV
ncbi:MAG: hypothetical protein U0797_05120 [Gemmataceae bacterium]